ncbi:hypothetical protein [Streptomyces humi]
MTRRITSPEPRRRPDRATVVAAEAHAETEAAARAESHARRLLVGEVAYDTRQEREGVVRDHLDGYVWLRPPGGGLEWTAMPGDVEPVDDTGTGAGSAALRARVAVANARSRGEVL